MRSRSAPFNSRTVTLYVSVPRSTLPSPGGGEIVVPGWVGGRSALGCEDVDDVRVGLVPEVHHRCDPFPAAFAAAVMPQDHRGALEVRANPALVGSELRDGARVPLAHVELPSFTIPVYGVRR